MDSAPTKQICHLAYMGSLCLINVNAPEPVLIVFVSNTGSNYLRKMNSFEFEFSVERIAV